MREGIVTANLSWPETKIEPILWLPIIDPWYYSVNRAPLAAEDTPAPV